MFVILLLFLYQARLIFYPGKLPRNFIFRLGDRDKEVFLETSDHQEIHSLYYEGTRPEVILFSSELPKTRSGKIMRRLLRDIAEGRVLGDTTTLQDPAVVASLKKQYEETES